MDFTFGIITNQQSNKFLPEIIDSIKNLNIPNYEIIFVGESNIQDTENIKTIPFDESIKNAWITKKKNIITQNAKYDNIVYSHDYIKYDPDWYEGYLKYGEDFKVCCNVVLNLDNTRYMDWLWWDWPGAHMANAHNIWIPNNEQMLPYTETRASKFMYVNGSYWVAKRDVMIEFPLDENRAWCELEDVTWSKQVVTKYKLSINTNSTVRLVKEGKGSHWKVTSENVYNNLVVPYLDLHGN